MKDGIFSSNQPAGEFLNRYWLGLAEDRQGRAQLRRAEVLTDVVITPAFQNFLHGLRASLPSDGAAGNALNFENSRLAAAALAGLLARVSSHTPLERGYGATTAVLMAQRKKETDAPRISELRFRRLLQAADIEVFFPMLRRCLPQLDGRVDIHVLANDIWYWADRFRGDRQRRQWAYDYYAELAPRQQAG